MARRISAPILRILALSCLLVVVASACAPAAAPTTADVSGGRSATGTKRITAALRGSPKVLAESINEAGSGGVAGVREVERLINAGLAIQDEHGTLLPQIAQAVPSTDNGLWTVFPDGTMETRWTIKPSISWQDGTPFTSDDLAFTATVVQTPGIAIFRDPLFDGIDSFDAPDPRTFVVHWSRTFITADTLFSATISQMALPMPRHLLEGALADPSTFTQNSYWTSDIVGTGAYKLKEWVPDSHLVLEANPSYVLGQPKIDEIDVLFIGDPSTLAANILAGSVDVTFGGGRGISLEWATQTRAAWRDGDLKVATGDLWLAVFPQFLNPTPATLTDVRMRRALMEGIDRQEMTDTIQAGLAPIAQSIIPPTAAEYPAVQSSIVPYTYDPRDARQLIEAVGYQMGADGTYRDATGEPLAIEIRTTHGDDLQERSMLAIADYWQRLGIASQPLAMAPQQQNDREGRANRPAFEVVRQPSGAAAVIRFYGPQSPLPENNYTGINRTRYRDADFDALIDRYVTTIPAQPRMDTLAQIVHQMTDQLVVLGIYFDPDLMMVSNRLKNVRQSATLWNVYEWDVSS